jgi:NADPH:quinone reductase-like Zn-dependent oxidoreductase
MLELDGPRALCEREVLIEVKATGVGDWDEFVRAGRWDVGRKPPLALGVEAAGIITAAGQRLLRAAEGGGRAGAPPPGVAARWCCSREGTGASTARVARQRLKARRDAAPSGRT